MSRPVLDSVALVPPAPGINLAPRADEGALAVLQAQLPAAFEPLRAMELRQALVMLAGIVATVLVALLLARGITGPIGAITAAIRRVGAGDYSPTTLDSDHPRIMRRPSPGGLVLTPGPATTWPAKFVASGQNTGLTATRRDSTELVEVRVAPATP